MSKNPHAVALGSIKSDAKARAARENGRRGGSLPLAEIACTCGAGEGEPHRSPCRIYHTLKQRARRARLRGGD